MSPPKSFGRVGKPTHNDQLAAMDGWLTPDGVIYPCDPRGHGEKAVELGYAYVNGFRFDPRLIHLSDGRWLPPQKGAQPTQAQLDKIWDWCHHRAMSLPRWIRHAGESKTPRPEDVRGRPKKD